MLRNAFKAFNVSLLSTSILEGATLVVREHSSRSEEIFSVKIRVRLQVYAFSIINGHFPPKNKNSCDVLSKRRSDLIILLNGALKSYVAVSFLTR